MTLTVPKDPRMGHQLHGRVPEVRIFLKADVNEIPQLWAEVAVIRDVR